MHNNFILISFATENTPYEQIIYDYFLASIRKLEKPLEVYYRLEKNLGSWHKNTGYKPTFILDSLNYLSMYSRIIITDADATIEKYPQLFKEIPDEYDIGCHFLSWKKWYGHDVDTKELLSGTLYFKNNQKIRDLVEDWQKEVDISQEWEQKVLDRVLKKHPEINIYELPIEYVWIDTLPDGRKPLIVPDNDIVIRHHQVSRQYKKLLTK